jgi:hypothetical protein
VEKRLVREIACALSGALLLHHYQTLGAHEGQRPQQNRVRKREQQDVQAEANRQRHDARGRHHRLMADQPQAKSQILEETSHGEASFRRGWRKRGPLTAQSGYERSQRLAAAPALRGRRVGGCQVLKALDHVADNGIAIARGRRALDDPE